MHILGVSKLRILDVSKTKIQQLNIHFQASGNPLFSFLFKKTKHSFRAGWRIHMRMCMYGYVLVLNSTIGKPYRYVYTYTFLIMSYSHDRIFFRMFLKLPQHKYVDASEIVFSLLWPLVPLCMHVYVCTIHALYMSTFLFVSINVSFPSEC